MAIDKQKLFEIILETIHRTGNDCRPEWPVIRRLLEQVIFNDPTKGCRIKGKKSDWNGLPKDKSLFWARTGCGLPIGNLTSQLFSNIYLDKLDQYCKRVLKCKHYGRYVDDFYIVAETKKELVKLIEPIRQFLKDELMLTLHPKKIWLHRQEEGVPFLGYVLYDGERSMSRRGRSKMNERLAVALSMEQDPYKTRACVNSYEGYSRKFDDGGRKWFKGNRRLKDY